MSLTAPRAALGLSYRLALVIDGLCRAVGVRSAEDRSIPAVVLNYLAWVRLRRLAVRFAALMAAVRAGRLAAARPAHRRVADPFPRLPPPPPLPFRLPRGFGWLLRLVPETAAYTGQVEHWLAHPELEAVIAAAPQAGRILRPLCRMLAIPPPPALRPPPREPASAVVPGAPGRFSAPVERFLPEPRSGLPEPSRPARIRSRLATGADPPLALPVPA